MEHTIKFDPEDLEGMRKIMEKYGDIDCSLGGENQDGEDIEISISKSSIVVVTFQKDGFVRKNFFGMDGKQGETFEGRWRD